MSWSKGVECYYYNNSPMVECCFTVPGHDFNCPSPSQIIQSGNLQVSSSEISGWDNWTGAFTWTVVNPDVGPFESQTALINSFDGNLEGGTMTDQMATATTFPNTSSGSFSVSFGFYDSGDGASGLSNQDQAWVYVSGNNSNWVGNLMSQNQQAPIGLLVLPGAHDSGMCTMENINTLIANNNGVLAALCDLLVPGLGPLIEMSCVTQTIMNAAITQKDSIGTMLQLGVRYFDFRPGYMQSDFAGFPAGAIYHQHACIPGLDFPSFIQAVVQFLSANPAEIVFISLNTQGFVDSSSMTPSTAALNEIINPILSQYGLSESFCGDASNLGDSYAYMIQNNTRIIFLNQLSSSNNYAAKYDSYFAPEGSYQTLDPSNVVAALASMTTAGQSSADYTVLQLQDTATSAISPEYLVSLSYSASPLMATKPSFDQTTLPWVQNNALNELQAQQPIVLLNDFIDPYTVDVAIALSTQRIQQWSSS